MWWVGGKKKLSALDAHALAVARTYRLGQRIDVDQSGETSGGKKRPNKENISGKERPTKKRKQDRRTLPGNATLPHSGFT